MGDPSPSFFLYEFSVGLNFSSDCTSKFVKENLRHGTENLFYDTERLSERRRTKGGTLPRTQIPPTVPITTNDLSTFSISGTRDRKETKSPITRNRRTNDEEDVRSLGLQVPTIDQ